MTNKDSVSSDIGIKDLLEAGLHFGHQTKRWNPKMKRFIFDKRNGIYIIDLTQCLSQLKLAQQFIYETVSSGKRVIFVGTKRLSQEIIKDAATRCGQYYMINRWLGGTLTNFQNIKSSIAHMRKIEELEEKGELAAMPQKEASRLRHELIRLQRNLSGITDMSAMPGALIIIDINREANAVKEANRMGIPVVALVDTNCDPDPIDYPVPGNDDAIRSVKLIVNCFADIIVKAAGEYASFAAGQAKKKKAEAEEKEKAKAAAKPADVEAKTKKKNERKTGDEPRSRSKTLPEAKPAQESVPVDSTPSAEETSGPGTDVAASDQSSAKTAVQGEQEKSESTNQAK